MDIRIDDCWLDDIGSHWFCKVIVERIETGQLITETKMVRYMDHGFHIMTQEDFASAYPDAKLYLREGRHQGE